MGDGGVVKDISLCVQYFSDCLVSTLCLGRHLKVLLNVSIPKVVKMYSTFDPSSSDGAVGSSGTAPTNHCNKNI